VKNILSLDARTVLEEVARERRLLAFDFDGTLAPIVPEPARAAMSDTTRTLLRIASLLFPCAVISGRSRSDLLPRLAGVPLVAVVGNHGAEAGYGPVDNGPRDVVAGWREALDARLNAVPGVQIEDKGLSLAIHYRRATSKSAVRRAIRAAADALGGARLFGGHSVVNVVASDSHDKGMALAGIASRVGATRALYVGDDTTDEDAFRAPFVSPAVRVGRAHASAARYYLSSQADIDDLLRVLICARRGADGMDDDVDGLLRAMKG
jgi:trehalose 6-phosphate phosphatase